MVHKPFFCFVKSKYKIFHALINKSVSPIKVIGKIQGNGKQGVLRKRGVACRGSHIRRTGKRVLEEGTEVALEHKLPRQVNRKTHLRRRSQGWLDWLARSGSLRQCWKTQLPPWKCRQGRKYIWLEVSSEVPRSPVPGFRCPGWCLQSFADKRWRSACRIVTDRMWTRRFCFGNLRKVLHI